MRGLLILGHFNEITGNFERHHTFVLYHVPTLFQRSAACLNSNQHIVKVSDGTCPMPERTSQTLGLAFLSGTALGAVAGAVGQNIASEGKS